MNNHCIFQCIDGSMYGFGDNEHGQLGISSKDEFVAKPVLLNYDFECLDIALGHKHTLFLTTNHEVYVCGSNSQGQLGLLKINGQVKPTKIMDNVKLIACGCYTSLIYTFDDKLYEFGRYREFKQKILKQHIKVTSMVCDVHKYCLYDSTKNDFIFANEKYSDYVFVKNNIMKITSGYGNFLFLNDLNQIYGIGDNVHKQLCLLGKNVCRDLILIEINPNLIIKDISCTIYCVLYLTQDGEVYYSGRIYGVNNGGIENMKLLSKNVSQMISGSSYIILIKDDGKMMMVSDYYSNSSGNTERKNNQWKNGEIIIDKKVSMINGKIILWEPEYHKRLNQNFKDGILMFMMIYNVFKKLKIVVGKYVIFYIIRLVYN